MAVRIEELSSAVKVGDLALWPVMYLLGGLKKDSVQRTHFWHSQKIDRGEIRKELCVRIVGDDTQATVRSNRVWPFPLFHAPVFGGWRKYTVLEVEGAAGLWHIGWMHEQAPAGSRLLATVQRLALHEKRVRVLNQSPGFVTEYYAFSPQGEQLPLRAVDEGWLGDMRYAAVPLL